MVLSLINHPLKLSRKGLANSIKLETRTSRNAVLESTHCNASCYEVHLEDLEKVSQSKLY